MVHKLSRRELMLGAALGSLAPLSLRASLQGPLNVSDVLKVNDLDRLIWREELDGFVPNRLYDMHTHLSRAKFNLNPQSKYTVHGWSDPAAIFDKEGSLALLDAVEALVSPGREVNHVLMANPYQKLDFQAANNFIARQALKKPGTRALMVVHPSMTPEYIEEQIALHRFIGFKPYLWYSPKSINMWVAHVTDFMPERQIAVANKYGLYIGLHLSKKKAIADPDNLDDLERLTEKYPRVRWILYHNARSYSAWALEKAAPRLRRLHNIWIEGSTVCETDAFNALFSTVDTSRIFYGTDDFDAGVTRGKYVTWGHAWAQMDTHNQTFNTDHCDGRMTFVRYEMLRAMRHAARNHRLSRQQIEDIFYNNAARFVEAVWSDLKKSLGA